MKINRNITVLSAIGLFAGTAHAQSSVAIYGLLDTGITYTNRVLDGNNVAHSKVGVHPGAMQASRLGFRGTEDLGDGLKALFILENGLNIDVGTAAQGGALFGRKAVVGMENKYGQMLLGRQTDFMDDMGSLSSTIDFGSQVALMHGLDRTYSERTNNSVRFNSKPVAGLSGTAMVGFGENPGALASGQTLNFGANYIQGGFRLAAGYYQSKLGTGTAASSADAGFSNIGAQAGAPGDTAVRTFTIGSAYQWGDLRIHGTYSEARQPLAVAGGTRALRSASNDKINVLDVGVSYALTGALNLNGSVIYDRVSFVGAPRGKLMQYNLGVDYYLSKRTDVYANSGFQTASNMNSPGMNEGAPGSDNSQLLLRVGIRHKF
jgi:predicted porin